jgi:hypothetical protein
VKIRYREPVFLLLLASASILLAQQPPKTVPMQPPPGPSPLQQLPGPNGQAKGSVVDDAGKPVAYARVFVSQALPANAAHPTPPPVITGPQVSSAMTGPTGQFSAFLPPGNYVACAETTTPGFLDPCHFGSDAPTFSVAKGQILTGVKLVMAKGAVVPIHIADPNGLLATPSGVIAPDCRVEVVTAKGYRYEAPITAHDATSRDHAITLPFGAAVTVQVISPHLTVTDSTGKPVSSAGASTVIPSGGSPGTFNFTVSGTKP